MDFDKLDNDPCFGCDLTCPGCPFEIIEEPEIRIRLQEEGTDKRYLRGMLYQIFNKSE